MPEPVPDFTRTTTLTGDLVRLVPARAEHARLLHPLLDDPEVRRLTGSAHSSTPGPDGGPDWSLDRLTEIYGRWERAADRLVWVIEDLATGRVVGESVLNDLEEANRSCGFRIWISGTQDRGLGTEAVRLTLRHAFEQQGLNRVGLEVYDINPRARHVYEKVGFVHEGTLRQALRFDDRWVDAHVMGILAEEWAANDRQGFRRPGA